MRRLVTALIILAFPLAEIAGFIFVGRQIGVLATIGMIIATSIAGSLLLRFQGMGVIRRLQRDGGGKDPGREVAHGVMILVAGVLLLIPGFLTDILGLLLFVPPVRDLGWRLLRRRLNATTRFATFSDGFRAGARRRGNVIELDEDDYSVERPPVRPGARLDEDR